jgi:hypothetical protein
MLLEVLYQLIETTGVSAYQEEKILTTIRNIHVSLEVLKEQNFYEPPPQEVLKSLFDDLISY